MPGSSSRTARVPQLIDEDLIGVAQHVGGLLGDFAENAHAESRARERMAMHHLCGNPSSMPMPRTSSLNSSRSGSTSFSFMFAAVRPHCDGS